MAFKWKDNGKIFMGEGIYHLTFVVAGRRPLLGELVAEAPGGGIATVERSHNTNAQPINTNAQPTSTNTQPINTSAQPINTNAQSINTNTQPINTNAQSINTNAQPINTNAQSINTNAQPINTNAQSISTGTQSINTNAELIRVNLTPYGKAVDDMLRHYDKAHEGITVCKRIVMDDHLHIVLWVKKQQYSTVQHKPLSILQIAYGMRIQFTHMAQDMGIWPKGVRVEGALHAEKGAGHIFEKQFVRTLSRKGQLRSMIDYVALNPYRKYSKRQHPELFTMHKDTEMKGLHFRSMGNHWLLDWPERQVVECSRDTSEEDLQRLKRQVMNKAEMGAVTYTAAKSKGEQRIARSIREAGWPLVVLMLDGFPPAGSDNEQYYKPGGVYFDACNAGKLLLLEAHESNYSDPRLIERTEAELKRKDQEKGYTHRPLPHSSKRWRMIAGNEMLKMIAGSPQPPALGYAASLVRAEEGGGSESEGGNDSEITN